MSVLDATLVQLPSFVIMPQTLPPVMHLELKFVHFGSLRKESFVTCRDLLVNNKSPISEVIIVGTSFSSCSSLDFSSRT